MNSRHRLTYVDLHPTHVDRDPPAWAIWAGAALALLAVWLITIFLFTL